MITVRPDDFALLRPVYENGDRKKRMLHYEVDNPPTVVFPDGAVRSCPRRIELLPHSADNRDASRWLTYRNGDSVQMIKFSDRANAVVQWRTIDGSFDVSWMSQGSSLGGNSHGNNERFFERYGTATQTEHNPTMSGMEQVPYREGSTDQTQWPPNPHFGPWPMHQLITPSMIESAGAPGEWDAESHGGGQDRPVLAWTQRHLGRVEPFFAGRRHLHRLTFWAWDRLGWKPGGAVGTFLGYVVPTLHCIGRIHDHATWLDIASGIETPIANWHVPDNQPPPGVLLNRRFAASLSWREYTGTDIPKENGPSPFSSPYACAAMRRNSDGWTLAVAMKLSTTNDLLTKFTQANLIQHLASGPVPVSTYVDSVSVFELASKGQEGRVPGWVGLPYILYTGPWASLKPALQGAMRDGLLDLPPAAHTVTLEGVNPP